jgi:hypothetical protein
MDEEDFPKYSNSKYLNLKMMKVLLKFDFSKDLIARVRKFSKSSVGTFLI